MNISNERLHSEVTTLMKMVKDLCITGLGSDTDIEDALRAKLLSTYRNYQPMTWKEVLAWMWAAQLGYSQPTVGKIVSSGEIFADPWFPKAIGIRLEPLLPILDEMYFMAPEVPSLMHAAAWRARLEQADRLECRPRDALLVFWTECVRTAGAVRYHTSESGGLIKDDFAPKSLQVFADPANDPWSVMWEYLNRYYQVMSGVGMRAVVDPKVLWVTRSVTAAVAILDPVEGMRDHRGTTLRRDLQACQVDAQWFYDTIL